MEVMTQRLGAMMAAANSNAIAVKDRRHIVRMHTVNGKGNDTNLFFRIFAAQDMDIRKLH